MRLGLGVSKRIWVGLFLNVLLALSVGQAQELDLEGVSLEDLLNVKTAVTSKKETSLRESAGIVSVVTDEEIKRMGARDLMDVLNLVPGVSFGNDVEGVVGVGFRGLWAYTGEFLFLVDGIEINEIQYGAVPFGNEFPVDQIQRIDIIRGPGSATYGGFAELIVVSVTTKKGSDIKGAASEVTLGRMEHGSLRTNVSASTGGKTDKGWDYSFGGYLGRAKRGEGSYTGYNPNPPVGPAAGTYDYKDADTIMPTYVNLGLSNENFNFRFLYDDYDITTRAYYDFTNVDYSFLNRLRSWSYLANYTFHPTANLKIVPQLTYLKQIPWQTTEGPLIAAGISKWEFVSERIKSSLTAQYDVNAQLNIQAGAEYISDFTEEYYSGDTVTGANQPFANGSTKLAFNDQAFFLQGIYSLGPYNFTLGGRYENPNYTRDSFVPRFAVTRAEKDWHAKLLYSEAFRTPSVMAYAFAVGSIKPEKSQTAEIEYGHTLGNGYLTGNIFDTLVRDPIVYSVASNGSDAYSNYLKNGTRGFELDYRQLHKWGQVQASYSYYERSESDVSVYTVPSNDKAMLGLPQHKVVVSSAVNLGKSLKVDPSLIYLGRKYGYEYNPNFGGMELKSLNDTFLANVFFTDDNLGLNGLSGGIGVFNIFDQAYRFAQPYGGTLDQNSPAPGPTRELVVKLDYKKEF